MIENFRMHVFRAVAHHLNFSRAAEAPLQKCLAAKPQLPHSRDFTLPKLFRSLKVQT